MVETSIIIRTKNEERWLGECLKRLFRQTYRNFEVVIVDSGSTDETLRIAARYPVTLVRIPAESFSFPYALNVGCMRARAERYFVFLSAHSLPLSETWLEDGLANFQIHREQKILGVYGLIRTLPDASIWERLYFDVFSWRLRGFFRNDVHIVRSAGLSVLGFTHAIIPRELWEEHRIDERYGFGGEDGEWARYWTARGYVGIRDVKFTVQHSHGLGLAAFIKQFRYWRVVAKPHPFKQHDFRH